MKRSDEEWKRLWDMRRTDPAGFQALTPTTRIAVAEYARENKLATPTAQADNTPAPVSVKCNCADCQRM